MSSFMDSVWVRPMPGILIIQNIQVTVIPSPALASSGKSTIIQPLRIMVIVLAGVAQLMGTSSHILKGCGFNF